AGRPDADRRWGADHAGHRRRGARRSRAGAVRVRDGAVAVRRGTGAVRRAAAVPAGGGRRMTDLDAPLRKVLGEKTSKALASHLDLETVGDLLYHFPRRYDERGEHTDIRSLAVGEQVTVMAQVQRTHLRPMRARRGQLLEVTVGDGTGGVLGLTFFNQAWRERGLTPGWWGLFAGKVTEFRGKRQLNGADYVILDDREDGEIEEFAGALIPVYPAAAAVPTWVIARCVRVVLDTLEPPPDPLPSALRARRKLVDLG